MLPRMFLLCVLLLPPVSFGKDSIVVSSEIWLPHYTLQDGSGLYQEIVREVYAGYSVNFVSTSYERSIQMVREGNADMWLGAYLDEEEFAIFPQEAFDVDDIMVFYRKGEFQDNGAAEQFRGATACWVREYDIQLYFPELAFDYYESADMETCLSMLLGNRIQVFVNDLPTAMETLKQFPGWENSITFSEFAYLGLYPGFADTAKSRVLIKQWDRGIKSMKKSGRLQALFKRLNEPYLLDGNSNLR